MILFVRFAMISNGRNSCYFVHTEIKYEVWVRVCLQSECQNEATNYAYWICFCLWWYLDSIWYASKWALYRQSKYKRRKKKQIVNTRRSKWRDALNNNSPNKCAACKDFWRLRWLNAKPNRSPNHELHNNTVFFLSSDFFSIGFLSLFSLLFHILSSWQSWSQHK